MISYAFDASYLRNVFPFCHHKVYDDNANKKLDVADNMEQACMEGIPLEVVENKAFAMVAAQIYNYKMIVVVFSYRYSDFKQFELVSLFSYL